LGCISREHANGVGLKGNPNPKGKRGPMGNPNPKGKMRPKISVKIFLIKHKLNKKR